MTMGSVSDDANDDADNSPNRMRGAQGTLTACGALGKSRFTARLASLIATLIASMSMMMHVAHAATVEREGMRYEDVVRVGNTKLLLNGIGVRSVVWLKGYVAGLYLSRKEVEAEQVYALQGPKRIAVKMLLDIDSGLLARTFSDGIRKNYRDEELEALRPRMDAFDAQLRAIGGVKKGDAINLDYQPATGTRIFVNGKARGDVIAGDDFYVALLKMFIGERAIDKNLRAALLGKGS